MSTPIVILLLRLLPWVLKEHPEILSPEERGQVERFLGELRGK